MFRTKTARLVVAASSFMVMVSFQNCSVQEKGEQNVISTISGAKEIDQSHADMTHDPDSIPSKPKPAVEVSVSTMDRTMIYAVLTDTFGPSSMAIPSINILRSERDILGGPCSMYENFRSKNAKGDIATDPYSENCSHSTAANRLGAPLHASANVLQQARINDACRAAVGNANAFNYVSARIGGTATALPQNTSDNVLKLFRLFYRGKPEPDDSLVTSLRTLVGSPVSADGWKAAILTTCVSSHWQAL